MFGRLCFVGWIVLFEHWLVPRLLSELLHRSATHPAAIDGCSGGEVLVLKRTRQVGDPDRPLIIIFRLPTWFLQEFKDFLFHSLLLPVYLRIFRKSTRGALHRAITAVGPVPCGSFI
jgi:hypothetical protein